MSGKKGRKIPRKPPVKKPPQKPVKKPSGKQFGTSSTDQENHVSIPPELQQDQYGNDFIKTMLA